MERFSDKAVSLFQALGVHVLAAGPAAFVVDGLGRTWPAASTRLEVEADGAVHTFRVRGTTRLVEGWELAEPPPPKKRTKAEIEPNSGHGLGSTR